MQAIRRLKLLRDGDSQLKGGRHEVIREGSHGQRAESAVVTAPNRGFTTPLPSG